MTELPRIFKFGSGTDSRLHDVARDSVAGDWDI